VLLLDVSGSRDEHDFPGSDGKPVQRLEAVKRVLTGFVESRSGDRIGLIVFGSKAFVQAPFTLDHDALKELIASASVGMAGPHTVVGDAIGLAIRTFEASDLPHRLLILLTDGADTGSRMSPLNAAAIAARHGVEIDTIGVGDPEQGGEDRVDLALLEQIASLAGGAFFRAEDQPCLEQIYARIDAATPLETRIRSYRPRHSLGMWPASGVVALILITYALLLLTSRPRAEER